MKKFFFVFAYFLPTYLNAQININGVNYSPLGEITRSCIDTTYTETQYFDFLYLTQDSLIYSHWEQSKVGYIYPDDFLSIEKIAIKDISKRIDDIPTVVKSWFMCKGNPDIYSVSIASKKKGKILCNRFVDGGLDQTWLSSGIFVYFDSKEKAQSLIDYLYSK